MKALFKNTPMSAFTPSRQVQLEAWLEEINALHSDKFPTSQCPYLVDVLLKHAEDYAKNRASPDPLIENMSDKLDLLACLQWDGMDVNNYIANPASIFHAAISTSYSSDLVDSEDDHVFQGVVQNGLSYLALFCNGLEGDYRNQAIKDIGMMALEWSDMAPSNNKGFSNSKSGAVNKLSLIRLTHKDEEISRLWKNDNTI